jgi:ABC-type microcin C transport system permease subunit YejB
VLRYVVRRVFFTVPVLLGVATLVFSLIHMAPGDPALADGLPGILLAIAMVAALGAAW